MLWVQNKVTSGFRERNFPISSLFYFLPHLPNFSKLSLSPKGHSVCHINYFWDKHTHSHRSVFCPYIMRKQLKSYLTVGCFPIFRLVSPTHYLVTIIIILCLYIILKIPNELAFSELILSKIHGREPLLDISKRNTKSLRE